MAVTGFLVGNNCFFKSVSGFTDLIVFELLTLPRLFVLLLTYRLFLVAVSTDVVLLLLTGVYFATRFALTIAGCTLVGRLLNI